MLSGRNNWLRIIIVCSILLSDKVPFLFLLIQFGILSLFIFESLFVLEQMFMCKALIKSDKVGMIFMIVELVYWLVMVGTVHTGYDVRLLVLGGVFLSDLLCSKNRSHYLNREKYEFGKLSYSKHKKMSYIVFSYLSVIVVNVLSVILIQTGLHFIILSGFITGMFLLFDNWTKKSILDSLRDELQFLIRTLYCLLFYVPVVHNLLVASCSVLKYGVLYLYVYLFSMLYHSFSLVSYMELSTCDKED